MILSSLIFFYMLTVVFKNAMKKMIEDSTKYNRPIQ